MTDAELEAKIAHLKKTLLEWAKSVGISENVAFRSYEEHFNYPPRSACVLVMCGDGPPFYGGPSGVAWSLDFLMRGTEFCYEYDDYSTIVFVPKDQQLSLMYERYFEFRWMCRIVAPDFSDIYQELFDYFSRNPQMLSRLEPRGFEQLLQSIFKNLGYRAELGAGWGDGGVDLRLYHHDVIGEIVTLVQAKRYRQDRAIRLEAVAALNGILEDKNASRGLFVTTSRFLPSAKTFAERQSHRISLATSPDVGQWCSSIARHLSSGVLALPSDVAVDQVVGTGDFRQEPMTIVHASTGFNTIQNVFCVIARQTARAALLYKLKKKVVEYEHSPYSGFEIPILDCGPQDPVPPTEAQIKALKDEENDGLWLWAEDGNVYRTWDGKPSYFNMLD